MKVLTEKEFEELPHGEWIDCTAALPPVGWEVAVKTVDGKITALTRFIRYEDAPAEHGYWDNNYPGKGNLYIFAGVASWCRLPSPDSPFSAQLSAVTAQRDEMAGIIMELRQFSAIATKEMTTNVGDYVEIFERAVAAIAKCEVQNNG